VIKKMVEDIWWKDVKEMLSEVNGCRMDGFSGKTQDGVMLHFDCSNMKKEDKFIGFNAQPYGISSDVPVVLSLTSSREDPIKKWKQS